MRLCRSSGLGSGAIVFAPSLLASKTQRPVKTQRSVKKCLHPILRVGAELVFFDLETECWRRWMCWESPTSHLKNGGWR